MDSSVLLFFEKMPPALPIYEAFTKRLLKELGPVPDGSGAERAFIWL